MATPRDAQHGRRRVTHAGALSTRAGRDRKTRALFTDASDVENNVILALRAIREAYVTLIIVGLPGADREGLSTLAREAGGKLRMLDGKPNSAWRTTSLDNLTGTIVHMRE
jgi:hypothetical protein